jgi:hypothetical protein
MRSSRQEIAWCSWNTDFTLHWEVEVEMHGGPCARLKPCTGMGIVERNNSTEFLGRGWKILKREMCFQYQGFCNYLGR